MDGGDGEIVGFEEAAAMEVEVLPPPHPPPGAVVDLLGLFRWLLEEVDEGEMEFEESAVEEMMKMLEREISMPSPAASAGGSNYQAPGFVTINSNEEMCGSSFSDHSSTVMANVDTRGLANVMGASYLAGVPPVWVAPAPPVVWGEEDDEWLEQLIDWDAVL